MTKSFEKHRVIALRKRGKSYSEIKKIVDVSKSSLSLWLRDIALTEDQINGLKKKKLQAVERYKESMRVKRETRLNGYYSNQLKIWLPLSKREAHLAGLFLYWGEGNKVSSNSISISNTDPAVIRFTYHWMRNCLGIPKDKITVMLHLYRDMNVESEIEYWQKQLGINRSQFRKPYIKKTFKADIDQKGFGHGTCGLWAFKTEIKENIMMAIKAISSNYA